MGVIDPSFWAGRRVLVTGHTGFKGAWLSLWLERLGAHVTGLALAPEDPAGAYVAFQSWGGLESNTIDLRNAEAVKETIGTADAEIVFHLGAQSLVRRGWADPAATYVVNVVGTANVLEGIANAGAVRAVVVVTSDKVYANSGAGGAFQEDAPLGGNDPYSASKASAELVVNAWRNGGTKIPVATVRAGNVIGGGDSAEDRLLPDVWRAMQDRRDLVLRNPAFTRPWQFVLEPLAGYLLVAERLVSDPEACPQALNFGPPPSGSRTVAEVAEIAIAAWGSGRWTDGDEAGAPSEAQSLCLDTELATRTLGWRCRLDLETSISWTVEWWRAFAAGSSLRSLALAQIQSYEDLLE